MIINSGFAGFLAGVNAYKISDEELERICAGYILMRIHRTEARTGPGGPGDLAWVWPLATFTLLFALLFGRKRRS